MKPSLLVLALLAAPVACASSAPPPAEEAPPPPPPAVVAPSASAAPAAAPEPTAEEKKKAADMKELADDRAKFEADAKTELARWTPELHAEAKALASKAYATPKAALDAVLAGERRQPGNAARDKYRHPAETLTFFGWKPTMTMLEYSPGDGWYTELLAPALATKGKLLVTSSDPKGPADQRGTFYGQRLQSFLDTSPEAYSKVERIIIADSNKPALNLKETVDLAVVIRGMHGWTRQKLTPVWLAEIHAALKPNGVLGVVQHRAKPDAKAEDAAKTGYLPEAWVIEQVEAAGFKLAGKSEINANPKDTKDYPEGVWTLPPTFELKDKDHDKYAAIGESDRMTLKFTKVAAKAAPKK
ncbi:MAG: class I SAM-dependent methyltransferase [Byssovorax sp.]